MLSLNKGFISRELCVEWGTIDNLQPIFVSIKPVYQFSYKGVKMGRMFSREIGFNQQS